MVWDVERGAPDKLQDLPWQTCSCIGDWHYSRWRFDANAYKKANEVILMLVDIVSKNGNLLLNIPVRGDGSIDDREIEVLEGIAKWMDENKESIFGTRTWKVYGEGPTVESANPIKEQGFNEGKVKFSEKDIRFNQKENVIYATVMGVPTEDISLKSFGKNKVNTKIKKIEMLGSNEKLSWKLTSESLVITKPKRFPNNIAVVFKIKEQ